MREVSASLEGRDSPRSAHPITAPRASDLARIVAITLFGLAVLWPIAWVALHGYTLTGSFEETVGYRYFYSLRKVYDPPVYLFTAQGQSIDVVQELIQIALTWLGFPVTQVQPRIDYFCYASMTVFQLLNIGAFAWMIWRIESVGALVVTTLFWLLPFYEPHQSGIYTLLQPDYMVLECALALVAAGSVLRTYQSPELGKRQIVFFGLFIGVAAATKITFLIFPAGAFAFAVLQVGTLRGIVVKSVEVGAIALLCGLLIALADSEWHLKYVLLGAKGLLSFMAAGSGDIVKQNDSWPVWYFRRLTQAPVYLAMIYATPLVALVAVLLSKAWEQFELTVPLMLFAIASNYFLYKRDYPNSLIEAAWLFEFVVFAAVIVLSGRLPKKIVRTPGPLLQAGSALVLGALIAVWIPLGVWSLIKAVGRNTREQIGLAAAQQEVKGRRLWLVTTNFYRPLSINSAIMKGGAVGNSPAMNAMFPDRDYRFQDPRPVRLKDYGAVLFVAGAPLGQAITRISSEYSIDLSAWRCRQTASLHDPDVGASSHQDVVICTSPKTAGGS